MKKRQKKMLNSVPDEPDPEFVGMTRDLAHHLVQKYGNEVFRIGSRRFAILALTEISCTPEEIADTWRLSKRTVRRHQSWINRNLSLAVACAEENAEQAAGLAAAQEAEKVIAEYLPDAPAPPARIPDVHVGTGFSTRAGSQRSGAGRGRKEGKSRLLSI
jgi:hypothetical protein